MTKKELTQRCRKILENEVGVEITGGDFSFLMTEIFPYHNRWNEKKGVGVDKICVAIAPKDDYKKQTRCFKIIRSDGTCTDISFTKCIARCGREDEYDKQLLMELIHKACRTAIQPILAAFKKQIKYPFVCPLASDIIVTCQSECHIDHYDLDFKDVVKQWLELRVAIFDKIKDAIVAHEDNSSDVYFNNERIIEDFQKFHNEHTHLRAVSQTSNLKRKR